MRARVKRLTWNEARAKSLEPKAILWRTRAVERYGEKAVPPLEYFIALLSRSHMRSHHHTSTRYTRWYTIYDGTPEEPR